MSIGLDKHIDDAINKFNNNLWTTYNNLFVGRSFNIPNKNNQKSPHYYLGSNEYREIFVDDNYDSIIHFHVENPRPNNASSTYTADVYVMVAVNLGKIYGSNTRAAEQAHGAVNKVLRKTRFNKISNLVTDIEAYNIYDITDKQTAIFDMQPYYVFRFETSIMYSANNACDNTEIIQTATINLSSTDGGTATSSLGGEGDSPFTVNKNTNVAFNATSETGYRFRYWLLNNIQNLTNPLALIITKSYDVVANFIKTWQLTTSVDGNGTISPVSGVYDDGDIVEIVAEPTDPETDVLDRIEVNSVEVSNTSPYQLLMDGVKVVVAYFQNLIPYYSDAIEVWNGNIIELEGVYYLEGAKGVGNLKINNYDFADDRNKGVPYKTKATISAPADNTILIAADVNNFFYDSGGTPNQIPAVLFFQNVDYAGRLFTLHNEQLVVDFPIETEIAGIYEDYELETQQASLQKIVLYANEKTGIDLDTCNSFYNVPTKQTSNIREVGAGKTYSTINAAITAAVTGDRIYVYTGTYTENVSVPFGKALEIYGLGNVVIQPTSGQTYTIQLANDNCKLTNVRINANGASLGLTATKNNITITKCYFEPVSDRTIWFRGTTGFMAHHSVFLNVISFTSNLIGNFETNGCYLSNISTTQTAPIALYGATYISSPVAGTTFEVSHSVINRITTLAITNVVISAYADNILIQDNIINSTAQASISSPANLNFRGNSHIEVLNRITCQSGFHNFYSNKFLNNKIVFNSLDGGATENRMIYQYKSGIYDLEFKNNIIIAERLALEFRQPNTFDYTVYCENNYIESHYSPSFGGGFTIYCVAPNASEDTEWILVFKNNRVKNPHDFDSIYSAHTCLYLWQMKRVLIEYNYLSGSETGEIVIKSATLPTTDAVNFKILYNLFVGTVSIIFKGVSNIQMYNNTCIRSIVNVTDLATVKIMANEVTGTVNNNLDIRNNIIVNELYQYGLKSEDIDSGEDYIINNNLYYSKVGAILNQYKQVDKTFPQWQALGFDTNGVEQNPNLDADFIPSEVIEIGENLGVNYENGIDISTDWGSAETLPNVANKAQGSTWQIGTYIK